MPSSKGSSRQRDRTWVSPRVNKILQEPTVRGEGEERLKAERLSPTRDPAQRRPPHQPSTSPLSGRGALLPDSPQDAQAGPREPGGGQP